MIKVSTMLGVGMLVAHLVDNAREHATGTGATDDPFRLTTHSPLLAFLGLVLIAMGE